MPSDPKDPQNPDTSNPDYKGYDDWIAAHPPSDANGGTGGASWGGYGSAGQKGVETIMDPGNFGNHGYRDGKAPSNVGEYASNWVNNIGDSILGNYKGQNYTPGIGNQGQNAEAMSAGGATIANGPNGYQDAQSRMMQMQLMQQLMGQANGTGPSLAQMQLQKAGDQGMAQAMALGASQRGAGNAGMLRNIQNQQAGINQGLAADSGMLRLQEQMQARQMLGQGIQGMRGLDQGWAGMNLQNNQFNAGQMNNMNQFNTGQFNTMTNANADRQHAAQMQLAQMQQKSYEDAVKQARDSSVMGTIGTVVAAM